LGVRVRKARQDDAGAVAALLYESSPQIYDRFSGNRDRAVAILERAFAEPGNVASSEVVWLVELEGMTAAAMAAFPITEGPPRARAFIRLALRAVPFWLWPRTLRLYSAGTRSAREDSLYIDALATEPSLRRRGAARALLDEAEREARANGLRAVTLDTTIDNEGARALYAASGYDEVAYRGPSRVLPGFVALVRPVDR
jgi:ribosomal protein S18 acetylase RimI-like enzyme